MLYTFFDRIFRLLYPVKVRRVVIYHADYVEVRNARIR